MSTSKPPEKGGWCLQDPLGRCPGVKQSVVGSLGVNRRREDESGVGRARYSQRPPSGRAALMTWSRCFLPEKNTDPIVFCGLSCKAGIALTLSDENRFKWLCPFCFFPTPPSLET